MPDAFNKTDVCNYLEAEIRLFNSARSEQLQFAHSRQSSNWMIAEHGGSVKTQRVVINQWSWW
ncbi:hypothetical protein [Enterobacter kobei]|uniref:hypothetical protein n=1 Tax=Enterobacter kobei TaxID=208224 RepID=UPI00388FCB95